MKTSVIPFSLRPATVEDVEEFHSFVVSMIKSSATPPTFIDCVREFVRVKESQEDLESIQRGLAEADAGITISLEEAERSIREELGWPERQG